MAFVGGESVTDGGLGCKIFPCRGADIRFGRYRGADRCKILPITEPM